MSTTIQKTTNVLPYGTTADNIVKLIDAIKNKQGDEKGIKATYSGAKIETTQATLETLGIISGLELSPLGKSIAFESDEVKKKNSFLKAVLGYAPYEYFLSYIGQSAPPSETELEALKNYWGKNSYGATANNRSEAAPVCFSIFQMAGLGEYIIGRKGKNTRFVWNENYADMIKYAQQDNTSDNEKSKASPENIPQVDAQSETTPEMDKRPLKLKPDGVSSISTHQVNSIIPASIEIKVDITEWDLDKIIAFFKVINGEEMENKSEAN